MGLFGKKENCCICGVEKGNIKISDGFICLNCMKKCNGFLPSDSTPYKNKTKAEFERAIKRSEQNKELLNLFTPTKKIGTFVSFDTVHGLWLIPNSFNGKINNPQVRTFDEILEYELLEDGNSITKGGLGRAIAGGVAFGGVGAIVGGVTGQKKTKKEIETFKIKVTTKDIDNPIIYINLLSNGKIKTSSFAYKDAYNAAQEILSVFAITQNKDNEKRESLSSADEIIKYKKLLDDGIITQEEFEAKKKQLLGL